MKRLNTFLLIFSALIGFALAQSPEKINFQTIVRDNMGVPMTSQNLDLRLSIANGPVLPAKVYYEEVFSGLTTDNFGLISVHIGTGTPDLINYGPFSDVLFGEGTLYLHIEVNTGNGYVAIGVSELVSVPHALHSNLADSVKKVTLSELTDVDISSANDGEVLKFNQAQNEWVSSPDGGSPWSLNGNKVYYTTDNVGIGLTNPQVGLTLGSSKEFAFATNFNPASQRDLLSLFGTSDFEQDDFIGFGYETVSFLNAQNQFINGRVSYAKSVGGHRWYIQHNAGGGNSPVLELDRAGDMSLRPVSSGLAEGAVLELQRGDGLTTIEFDASTISGSSLLFKRPTDSKTTIQLQSNVLGKGRLTIDEIEIKGGADFAERFDVGLPEASEINKVLPGMVVSIDPDNTGALTVSDQAYDRKVAGIVSGGGGIAPGMVMGQDGTIADGELPIALSGRVYVYVDESNGKIVPGDLLTTSNRPGYAMKVSNTKHAQGAIIGKAMSKIDPETGMVLVLVSLQ